MLGILLIFCFALFVAFIFPRFKPKLAPAPVSAKYNRQMKKLWSIAQTSMKEKKTVRAEKALLTILRFDEKNAAAYNRLGILYARGQKFDEAIECFEIAQSLDNNASSLHNAGLIYLETGAYEKATIAFRQALELEGDLPTRYIALAKAEEKIGNRKAALEALENAYELDRSTGTLRLILALHEAAGDTEMITLTTARIEQQLAENTAAKKSRRPISLRRAGRAKTITSRTAKNNRPNSAAKTTTHAQTFAKRSLKSRRRKIQ